MKWNTYAVSFLAALETARAFVPLHRWASPTTSTSRWMSTMDVENAEIDYFYDDHEEDNINMEDMDMGLDELERFLQGNAAQLPGELETFGAFLQGRDSNRPSSASVGPAVSGRKPTATASSTHKEEQPKKQQQAKQPKKQDQPWDPSQMSVAQLQAGLQVFGIDYSDCLEQTDLLKRWQDVSANPTKYLSKKDAHGGKPASTTGSKPATTTTTTATSTRAPEKQKDVTVNPKKHLSKQDALASKPAATATTTGTRAPENGPEKQQAWDPSHMSVAQLKAELDIFGADYSDCVEQTDFLHRWEDVRANPKKYLQKDDPVSVVPEEAPFVPPQPQPHEEPTMINNRYIPLAEDQAGFAQTTNYGGGLNENLAHSSNFLDQRSKSRGSAASGGQSVYGRVESEVNMDTLFSNSPTSTSSTPFQNSLMNHNHTPRINLSGNKKKNEEKQPTQPTFFHESGTISLEELEQQARRESRRQDDAQQMKMQGTGEQPKTNLFQGIQVEQAKEDRTQVRKKTNLFQGVQLELAKEDQTQVRRVDKTKGVKKQDPSADAPSIFNGQLQIEDLPLADPSEKRVRREALACDQSTEPVSRHRNDPQRGKVSTLLGIQVESADSKADPFENAFTKHQRKSPKEDRDLFDGSRHMAKTVGGPKGPVRGPDQAFNMPSMDQPFYDPTPKPSEEPEEEPEEGSQQQGSFRGADDAFSMPSMEETFHDPTPKQIQEEDPTPQAKPPPTTGGVGPAQSSYEGLWDGNSSDGDDDGHMSADGADVRLTF